MLTDLFIFLLSTTLSRERNVCLALPGMLPKPTEMRLSVIGYNLTLQLVCLVVLLWLREQLYVKCRENVCYGRKGMSSGVRVGAV